jgi:hypothetical protein
METEATMSKLVGVSSHHEWEVQELQKDREFAVEYLIAAMEALDNPEERAGGLLALRAVAEAYGGWALWRLRQESAGNRCIAPYLQREIRP